MAPASAPIRAKKAAFAASPVEAIAKRGDNLDISWLKVMTLTRLMTYRSPTKSPR